MPHLLSVVASLISRLRLRIVTGRAGKRTAAASLLLSEHIKLAGHLRGIETFEFRDAAELVLGAATEVCGPEFILSLLALNLDMDSPSPDSPGRAWLLPIFRSKITNTQLGHFTGYFVPLSEKMFAKYRAADAKSEDASLLEQSKKRAGIKAKVYEAVVGQIWALFPGYCDLPTDMSEVCPFSGGSCRSQLLTRCTCRPSPSNSARFSPTFCTPKRICDLLSSADCNFSYSETKPLSAPARLQRYFWNQSASIPKLARRISSFCLDWRPACWLSCSMSSVRQVKKEGDTYWIVSLPT